MKGKTKAVVGLMWLLCIRLSAATNDITTTLRRMCLYIPSMNPEERKRLAEYLRAARGAVDTALADLDKAEK